MTGINYVVDTNCFIYLLNRHPSLIQFLESKWAYSFITEIELLCQKDLTEDEVFIIKDLLDTCFKVHHTQSLTDLTIKIRRKYGLKVPDAIVAATAQLLQLPLITADKRFAKVESIDCILIEL